MNLGGDSIITIFVFCSILRLSRKHRNLSFVLLFSEEHVSYFGLGSTLMPIYGPRSPFYGVSVTAAEEKAGQPLNVLK